MPYCRRWIPEIVECARGGSRLDGELQRHLVGCSACSERFEAELRLTSELHIARGLARERQRSSARRDRLMREFQLAHRSSFLGRFPGWLKAAVPAAAVLVVALGLLFSPQPKNVVSDAAADAGDLTADSGFVPIPYALPAASGEFVSVVRTELQPAALAHMGIYVDAGYAGGIPADVLVGEDGLPRAVRVIDGADFGQF